jgi:glycerophosphoryl diester phosphodiesterase
MNMKISLLVFMALTGAVMTRCSTNNDTGGIGVQYYMPDNAVIAHRGTIYWAPELTEAAYRWARNAGADYVELDVRRSKDSVLVIMHDNTFRRTTDVAEKFPGREGDPVNSFTYEEIMQLDAGSAFNDKNPDRAREGFKGQDVLVFEDVFRIAEGKRIKRNPDGSRIYTRDEAGMYHFDYEPDPADNGHRPGVYIETKVPDQYPRMEEQVYDELAQFGWNPLEGEEISIDEPFWSGDRVNVGKTRGKVLLQTFSRTGMVNFQKVFHEQVLCSFLVSNPRANIFALDEVMDDIIVFALSSGAQFIGTNLGDENDGLSQAFADKIHAAHLKANIYSINTVEEMEKYFGKGKGRKASPLADGMITNRTDLTVDFYHARKVRGYGMEQTPGEILADLGY